MRLATSYLKEDNLREAAVWFTLLKEVSPLYQDDAVYNLAYIDYVEKRYDKALKSFQSLQNDAVYAALVPYYIGEILFGERKLSAGPYCGKSVSGAISG